VDEIYNLACPASDTLPIQSIKTMKTSVMGAINTLGLAKRVNAKILQASTSEVYGDPHPSNRKLLGNVNPIGIRSCYDEGKRCAKPCLWTTTIKIRLP
jgi:UDP-glucuronate decarboxylase